MSRPRGFEERVELAAQEIRHVERHHVVVGDLAVFFHALVEGEAVRPRHALDAVLFADDVQMAARAAVGIADEYMFVAFRPGLDDRLVHGRGDAVGIEMVFGRQAGQFEVVEAEFVLDRKNFARNHAATDDEQSVGDVGFRFLCHGVGTCQARLRSGRT